MAAAAATLFSFPPPLLRPPRAVGDRGSLDCDALSERTPDADSEEEEEAEEGEEGENNCNVAAPSSTSPTPIPAFAVEAMISPATAACAAVADACVRDRPTTHFPMPQPSRLTSRIAADEQSRR